MNRFLAVAFALALAGPLAGTNALADDTRGAPAPDSATQLTYQAKRALVCEIVADWSSYRLKGLIRDDAKENGVVSAQGMQIFHAMRETEGLASAAFETFAPEADHQSLYQAATRAMQSYLNEDSEGADANARQLMPVCQSELKQLVAGKRIPAEVAQGAVQASDASTQGLKDELAQLGYTQAD